MNLEEKLFQLDRRIQAAGFRPLQPQELRQLAQQMQGGGQPQAPPQAGMMPPQMGMPQ